MNILGSVMMGAVNLSREMMKVKVKTLEQLLNDGVITQEQFDHYEGKYKDAFISSTSMISEAYSNNENSKA